MTVHPHETWVNTIMQKVKVLERLTEMASTLYLRHGNDYEIQKRKLKEECASIKTDIENSIYLKLDTLEQESNGSH